MTIHAIASSPQCDHGFLRGLSPVVFLVLTDPCVDLEGRSMPRLLDGVAYGNCRTCQSTLCVRVRS